MLTWQVWHKMIAVNLWRGHISDTIDITCPVCDTGDEESALRSFGAASKFKRLGDLLRNLPIVWQDDRTMVKPNGNSLTSSKRFLPREFLEDSDRRAGSTLWTLWIARNDSIFNNCRWSSDKVRGNIWCGVQDYCRSAWLKTKARIKVILNPERLNLTSLTSSG